MSTTVWGADAQVRDAWPTAAQRDLLEAALLPGQRATDAWNRVLPLIDVPAMDGSTQALLPTLRRNLLRHGVEHPLLGLFKGVHRHTWARNQMLFARMTPVVAALESAGIPTLLLKGAALLAQGDIDAGMRAMGDLDVLVPTTQVREAVTVLGEHGLFPVGGVPDWYVLEYAHRFSPSYGFRDAAELQLDLHWHAYHDSCQPDADEELWSAALPAELHGVGTRVLCPADELLLVIVHGRRWSESPGYRWVIDAAHIARSGAVDYERLVRQARRRRVVTAVREGLSYLASVSGVPVPSEVQRALRPDSLDRAEASAQVLAPRHRSARQRALVLDGLVLRRELALGRRPSPAARVRARRRRRREWPLLNLSLSTIGDSGVDPPAHRLPIELSLDDPSVVRRHALHGVWPPEPGGAWLAGEAAFAVVVADPPPEGLVLDLAARTFVDGAQVIVDAGGGRSAELRFVDEDDQPVALGAAGDGRVDVRLRTVDAVRPSAQGVSDDDRELGVFVRRLRLRATAVIEDGEHVRFGAGGDEEQLLAGGWGPPEPDGRWTIGRRARLLLAPRAEVRELELDALANVVSDRGLRVTLRANGRPLAELEYGADDWKEPVRRIALHAPAGRQLELELEIDDPVSPRALGLGPDERPLGLRLRRLAVHGGGVASAPALAGAGVGEVA